MVLLVRLPKEHALANRHRGHVAVSILLGNRPCISSHIAPVVADTIVAAFSSVTRGKGDPCAASPGGGCTRLASAPIAVRAIHCIACWCSALPTWPAGSQYEK